jgi:GH24 family phage-related lysozyme (muramidase)
MFNIDRTVQQIRSDEGFRSGPYQDSVKVWTIGYGTTRVEGSKVTQLTRPISLGEARNLMQASVIDAISDCQSLYDPAVFNTLHDVHQEVLICLAYQLGRAKLGNFVNMNTAIYGKEYTDWVVELKDSRLYRQATNRCNRYIHAILKARWPTTA